MNSAISEFSVEGAGSTVVHPVGLVMLVICGAMLVLAPRKYALIAFIVLICFVSSRQAIAIGGFNFYFSRIMVLVFGTCRGILRGEITRFRWNTLDYLMISFGVVYFVSGAINWEFAAREMKLRSGYITELVGTYFLCRMLVQQIDDVKSVILGLAIVSLLVFCFFVVEHTTRSNLFSIFGGVPAVTIEREGRLRCQGAFGHPLLAGVFWATMLPLIFTGVAGRWKGRYRYTFGAAAALGIVMLTASSTPIMGVMVAIVGWGLFRWRFYARYAFAVTGLVLVVLHMIMQAPVWSLIQKINITSGNSGYHRYVLVDGFIRHASEWWLLGSTVGTAHWGHFTFDAANQFVVVGVLSGLGGLVLFVAVIIVAMKASGCVQEFSPHLGWGLGVSIFTTTLCFFGISIWGQLHLGWTLPIAIAGSLGFREGSGIHKGE